jgi:hypothetical protein
MHSSYVCWWQGQWWSLPQETNCEHRGYIYQWGGKTFLGAVVSLGGTLSRIMCVHIGDLLSGGLLFPNFLTVVVIDASVSMHHFPDVTSCAICQVGCIWYYLLHFVELCFTALAPALRMHRLFVMFWLHVVVQDVAVLMQAGLSHV